MMSAGTGTEDRLPFRFPVIIRLRFESEIEDCYLKHDLD
jgi:hypothetical protein